MTQPILSRNAEKFVYTKRANDQPSAFYVGECAEGGAIYMSRTRAGTLTPATAKALADKLYSLANSIEHKNIYLD